MQRTASTWSCSRHQRASMEAELPQPSHRSLVPTPRNRAANYSLQLPSNELALWTDDKMRSALGEKARTRTKQEPGLTPHSVNNHF